MALPRLTTRTFRGPRTFPACACQKTRPGTTDNHPARDRSGVAMPEGFPLLGHCRGSVSLGADEVGTGEAIQPRDTILTFVDGPTPRSPCMAELRA